MSTPLARPITEDEIRTYEETGVVHLKGLFDQAWIDHLREAMEYALIHPGKLAHNLSHDDPKGKFISETFLFHQHPGFREFVFQSPAAEIAAQVMRSTKANIVFDQHLVKEPETEQPTVWHHDLTYWPIRGNQVCTLWLALDPVREETGSMEFAVGSHRWGHRYHPVAFVDHSKYKTEEPPVPDVEAMRDELEFIRFDYEPGDCTVHHGLLLHMAGGNRSQTLRRRAYAMRWAGDDVVYDPRPNIQQMLWEPSMAAGEPLDSELWPVVRTEAAA
ncbi:MAG TPA: phytanoyl-CoA dioxygenase family protein [Alphaproteobacteria bacterium]|nr:phytanoyl-CoA dioxygenase family protein [Alphaproteobacteria bacterium]